MGFVLSVLYFITYYLTPDTVFGPLAAYRIELILAGLVLLVSLPAFIESFIGKTPQTYALIGLAFATFLSVLIGAHWATGAIQAFLLFIPNPYAYFLVCLHCNSKRKLQVVVLMMLLVCLFVTARGYLELQQAPVMSNAVQSDDAIQEQLLEHMNNYPYLLEMTNDAGDWFYRIRGLGQINDPNDFAQLIVCVVPLMFMFWKSKKTIRNIAFVILPVSVLLYGAFLTRSRGCLVALLAMLIVAGRRRIGIVPSLLMAGVLFAAMSALHFTGGRDISASSGEDRTSLWGEGLEILKSHPLFGVGFGYMPDNTDEHKTAHNSLVVCAVETGMFGLYFWSLFLFPTIRDVLAISSPAKVSEAEPIVPKIIPFPRAAREVDAIDRAEVCRIGRLLLLSLTGFLVAGWFLSRAFVMTLFLLGGFVEVVFQMALARKMIPPRLPPMRVFRYAGGLTVSLVLFMYVMLRIVNLTH